MRFTEVSEEAGLTYDQQRSADPSGCLFSSHYCEPDRMAGGAAAGDYDGDGWVDLYVTRADGKDRLYRNQGDGTFVDRAAEAGLAVDRQTNGAVWVDVDNDDDLDLYVTGIKTKRHFLYINDGNGRFSEQATERGAAIATEVDHLGFGIGVGDYNRDGWVDLYVSEWGADIIAPRDPHHARLLQNRGPEAPGHFEDVTQRAGIDLNAPWVFSPAFVDVTGDRWPDLLLTADFGNSQLFRNDRDGTFTDITERSGVGLDENGMGSTIADWDGDGDFDWFVSAIYDPAETCEHNDMCNWGYSGNRLYRNEAGDRFTDVTGEVGVRSGGWAWGSAFFDGDNDGDLDLVLTNGISFPDPIDHEDRFHDDPMRLWRNDGRGSPMAEVAEQAGMTATGRGTGLLVFDYDRDGDRDVFIVRNGRSPLLYRNDGADGRAWLEVEAVGRSSPRSGVGAVVTVIAQEGSSAAPQVRRIGSTTHFLGQSQRSAHFGFGQASPESLQVTVRWPSGARQTNNDVAPGQRFVVWEPLSSAGNPGPRPAQHLLRRTNDASVAPGADAGPPSGASPQDGGCRLVRTPEGSATGASPLLALAAWMMGRACRRRAQRKNRRGSAGRASKWR